MYTEWFKLQRLPFRLRPDPDFLYLEGENAAVFDTLRAAIISSRGVVELIGEAGVGKTTLLHTIAAEHQEAMSVARIQQPKLTAGELLEALSEQLHLKVPEESDRDVRAALKRFVAEEAGHGRSVLILVDEAQLMPAPTLRELLELGAREPAPLTVLAGTTELLAQLELVRGAGHAATPRATVLHLQRLDADAVDGYLRHRLKMAGSGTCALFDADTTAEIQRYTGGTPQLINQLCDAAMTQAEAHNSPRVGLTEVRGAAQDLKWIEFAARSQVITATSNPVRHPVRAELDVRRNGQPAQRVMLKPGRTVVGRGPDCGLLLDSQFVSRNHCQIITTADQTFVEDLGSTNGIRINGHPAKLHKLEPLDTIVVGDHTLTYLETPVP